MKDEIKQAIELLENNDYKVIKITARMKKAMDECEEEYDREGCTDCDGCICSICVYVND